MDDELHQLEAELTRLRPAAPSRELLARLERDLAPAGSDRAATGSFFGRSGSREAFAFSSETLTRSAAESRAVVARRPSRAWWLLAAALPAAAAITFWIVVGNRRDVVAPAVASVASVAAESIAPVAGELAVFKPVAAENVLLAARDEGLVTLADGTTARRARLQYVDTIIWKNPRTNASVRWTVPREEIRVVPVHYQ